VSPLWLRSLLAAVWTVALGLAALVIVALVVWSADSRTTSGAGTALRFAVAVWLAAQHTPLSVDGGTIAIAPLMLALILGLLLARFAAVLSRAASSQDPGAVIAMVIAVSLPYAGICAGLAVLARTDAIQPSVPGAFLAGAVFSVIATAAGGMRGAGQWRPAWDALPDAARDGLRAAGAAGAVLAGTAAALTIAAIVEHWSLVSSSLDGYSNGSGKFTMALLSLWLLPNAILFTSSYLSGVGFAVGAGATVSLGASHVGATPALPILAAVPRAAASWPVVLLVFVAAAGAAVLACWRIRRDAGEGLGDQLRATFALAVILAVSVTCLAAVSGGAAGPGRLTSFGPSPWQVGLSVAGEVAGPVLLFVAAQAWWRMWRSLPGR
jgi:hypothetical protein